jgi:primosomal protein N' (replication factor Y) (superfamily II helicase)
MPPFGRLAGLILSGTKLEAVMAAAHRLAEATGPLDAVGAQVFGPAPAPIARIRGRHRVRLLVKARRTAPLQVALRQWLGGLKLGGDLRLTVDIDPQSFL